MDMERGAPGKIKTILYLLPLAVKSGLGGSWRDSGIQAGTLESLLFSGSAALDNQQGLAGQTAASPRGFTVPVSRETNPSHQTHCVLLIRKSLWIKLY